MYTKVHKSIGMAVVAGLTAVMLVAAPVFAQAQPTTGANQDQAATTQTQTQPGTDFNTAGAPQAGSVQIAPHGTQWYKFKYHYDNSDTSNTPTQAQVKVKMEIVGSVSFA